MLSFKSFDQWCDSGKQLTQFVDIGDVVDEDFIDYFIGTVPGYVSGSVIQIGEPYYAREHGYTYMTIKKTANGWAYAGLCYHGQSEHIA